MLEISCNFMVYINNQSCIQVFSTTAGESKQLSNSSDKNLVYRKGLFTLVDFFVLYESKQMCSNFTHMLKMMQFKKEP